MRRKGRELGSSIQKAIMIAIRRKIGSRLSQLPRRRFVIGAATNLESWSGLNPIHPLIRFSLCYRSTEINEELENLLSFNSEL